jgi:hypothetical protein
MAKPSAKVDAKVIARVSARVSARFDVRRTGWRGLAVTAGAFLFVCLLGAAPAFAGVGDYRCTDTSRVYHGDARLIRNPATIAADRVYAQIPEYQEILRKGLTDGDVQYHFLMKEASKKFAKAVRAMARANGHDFVAEDGAVEPAREGVAPPPDRTSEVIRQLS